MTRDNLTAKGTLFFPHLRYPYKGVHTDKVIYSAILAVHSFADVDAINREAMKIAGEKFNAVDVSKVRLPFHRNKPIGFGNFREGQLLSLRTDVRPYLARYNTDGSREYLDRDNRDHMDHFSAGAACVVEFYLWAYSGMGYLGVNACPVEFRHYA